MSDDLSSKTALVVDHGLFLPLAHRLAESFGRVLYHTPWEEGFSKIYRACIGDGYSDLERCSNIWMVKDEVDLFVFPDIGMTGEQLELEKQGKRVWGSRTASNLELDRQLFLDTLKEVGLEVADHVVIRGIDKLRAFLERQPDSEFYIKISFYRGMQETTHWRSWDEDNGLLDLWSVKWGPLKDFVDFLVFDPIETPLEIGGDAYCVDGHWPSKMLHGIEWKDEGYFGAVTDFDQMPEQVKQVMKAFTLKLSDARYRNQISFEIRVLGDKFYYIDPTHRGGLPSTASQLRAWKNFPEIVWHGANGELIDPDPACGFTAECSLTLKGDPSQWTKTIVPTELKPWMNLAGCCEVNDMACFPPDCEHTIGWLGAIGDTPQETLDRIKEYSEMLPSGVSANVECLANIIKEIETEEKKGIEFTNDKMPEPAEVIE